MRGRTRGSEACEPTGSIATKAASEGDGGTPITAGSSQGVGSDNAEPIGEPASPSGSKNAITHGAQGVSNREEQEPPTFGRGWPLLVGTTGFTLTPAEILSANLVCCQPIFGVGGL